MNETCHNGIDDNCNGIVDEGCVPLVCNTSSDADVDTYKADFNLEYPVTDDPETQTTPKR